MSTKNLARTIIEGGREGYSKWNRRHSHGQERALSRTYLMDGMRLEHGFDAVPIGKRPKAYKSFADKLGAPRRWLRSHVGRPWSAVRAEMFARFDPRTLAGQHILFDHMLREVRMPGDVDPWWRRDELFVDAHDERCCCPRRNGWPVHGAHEHHRQDRHLTAEETAFFAALCEWHKSECLHVPVGSGS